jgi:hypothetical protein
MTSILRIQGDPATWALGADSPVDVIHQALISRSGPVGVNVIAPLKGRMILSTRLVASVALLTPSVGWIPGGAILPRAALYVPSPAGPTETNDGYTLAASVNLATLESEIVAAMTHGTTIAVPVTDGNFAGPLVLNGSTLSFAVVCQPAYAIPDSPGTSL